MSLIAFRQIQKKCWPLIPLTHSESLWRKNISDNCWSDLVWKSVCGCIIISTCVFLCSRSVLSTFWSFGVGVEECRQNQQYHLLLNVVRLGALQLPRRTEITKLTYMENIENRLMFLIFCHNSQTISNPRNWRMLIGNCRSEFLWNFTWNQCQEGCKHLLCDLHLIWLSNWKLCRKIHGWKNINI